jgi:hypothetical protein
MKTLAFPDGTTVSALGKGTCMMAEDAGTRAEEIAALRAGSIPHKHTASSTRT